MEIIQSKANKVIAMMILVVMLMSITCPVFAAYTDGISKGDKLKLTADSWYIYKTETAAKNLDKTQTNGTLKKNDEFTVQAKNGNVLKIGESKYIYYGSTGASSFKKISSATTEKTETKKETVKEETKKTNIETPRISLSTVDFSGIWEVIKIVIDTVVTIIKNLISSFEMPEVNVPVNKETDENTIVLDKSSKSINVGGTVQLTATVNSSNKNVTWTSGDTKVATVDKNGLVKGIAVGTTTITAKLSNGEKATCKITVNKNNTNNSSGNYDFIKKGKDGYQIVGYEINRYCKLSKEQQNNNMNEIIKIFRQETNYNDAVIAGVLANAREESFYNPSANDKDTNGVYSKGIWRNNEKGLYPALVEYCEKKNLNPGSLKGQTLFVIKCMESGNYGNYNNFSDNQDGAVAAAEEFRAKYEKGGGKTKEKRKAAAKAIYNRMKGNG